MTLEAILINLSYPCTINLSVLNEEIVDIHSPFSEINYFPKKYNGKIHAITSFNDYLDCDIILLEQVSKNEYNIDVY